MFYRVQHRTNNRAIHVSPFLGDIMTKYIKRRGSFWKIEDGLKTSISGEEYMAGLSLPAPLPIPEVREYDSLEEAIAEEG